MLSTLESERLILEPLSLKHLTKDYLSWLNNPSVSKFLETDKDYTMEMLENYLSNVEKSIICFWAIHIKNNNLHIGNIKIDPINSKHSLGEYGIMIGDDNEWGKGYAFEASTLVIDYCFNFLNLRKINLGVIENNIQAVNLYNKLGFITEGKFKYHYRENNEYLNTLRMALFNPKFKYI